MKQKYIWKFSILVLFLSQSFYSQTVIDDFTDGNFTSDQTWSGSTTYFSVITDATLPNGNASTDGSYLASNASQGDVSLAITSSEVSEWRFSLGSPDFNPSSTNYIGVVLMASAAFSGDMVSNNFQGYYLRIGTSGTADPISLWRKTGVGTAEVGDFPSSPDFATGALRDGINIRVTRSSSGVFELFYSTGFDNNTIPTTSAGTLTNNTYTTSNYFGLYQNINNPSTDRRVYIDNIQIGAVTWDGSSSSDWATAANWDSNTIPTSTDNLIIPSGLTNYPTVTTGETINSLIISSGASLVASNASFTVTSNAIYNRNLANASQWYFISSPVVGETYDATWVSTNSVASGSGDNRGISTYDNSTNDGTTGHWRYLQSDDSNSSTFNDSQGYGVILSSAGDVSLVGSGIYTADQSITITQGVNNFNLVGNPFTSYYKLGDLFTGNSSDISTTAWFWNGSSYTTRVSGISDTFNANYLITPGEGFFVSSLLASTSLNFTLSNANHEDSFSSGSKTDNTITRVTLNIKENSNSREARIYYIEGTTTGYDNGYEGKLFGGASDSFEFYSHLVDNSSTEKYQTQTLPKQDYENMIVSIGLKANAGKEITFTAETLNIPNGLNVYLEDRATNTVTQLNETNAEYTITLTENLDGIGRFYLHTKASAVLSTDTNILNSVSIFNTNSNTLRIAGLQQGNASVKLYNMLGKEVLKTSFQTTGVSDINLLNLTTGVYIVQLTTENGSINKKITLE